MSGGTRPDLSISMVSLGSLALARQCLSSIAAHTATIAYEIHVVAANCEPAAVDALQRDYPHLVVHRVTGVRGYSENNNVALRVARGRYVAILNDDTILQSDVFGTIVGFLDGHPDVAAACPVLRNADGTLQMGVRGRFTPLGFVAQQLKLDRLLPPTWGARLGAFDRPWVPTLGPDHVEIDVGTGACFVVRRAALEAIGFLDETFFLGPDDIDWSTRLRRHGAKLVLLPGVSLTHLGSATLTPRYHAVLPTVYAGCYTYFRRYYGAGVEWLVRLALGAVWSALLAVGWSAIWGLTRAPRARTMMRARANCVRFALSGEPSGRVFARLIAPSPPRTGD